MMMKGKKMIAGGLAFMAAASNGGANGLRINEVPTQYLTPFGLAQQTEELRGLSMSKFRKLQRICQHNGGTLRMRWNWLTGDFSHECQTFGPKAPEEAEDRHTRRARKFGSKAHEDAAAVAGIAVGSVAAVGVTGTTSFGERRFVCRAPAIRFRFL